MASSRIGGGAGNEHQALYYPKMITGDDYIQFAGRLAARRNADEATYRSAVSRAYYGAFHLADALLSSLGFNVPKGASAHG